MKKLVFLSALLLIAMVAVVQAQSGNGEIAGFVYDEQGAVIPGAKIVISGPNLLGDREITSGSTGAYRAMNLPPGQYRVEISKDNYKTKVIEGINVRAGQTGGLNITLEVGEFEDVITIQQEAPLIDVQSSERRINIDGEFISRLPITYDREWDSVWALVPGTVNEGQYGPYGNRVTVQGASIFQNVWNLDGMNIGSTFTNANEVYFSPDIIEDVELVTTGFDASIASGQGGYVNVVTKSGGNEFAGSAALTYQPTSWNWSNVDDGEAAEQSIILPDFTLGGPIQKDRAWFFSNYRYNFREEAYSRTSSQLALFDTLELPKPTQKRETKVHHVFGKVTYAVTDYLKVVGAFNYDEGTEFNADMGWNYADNSGVDIERGGQYYKGSVEGVAGENFDYNFNIAYYKSTNLIFGSGGLDEPGITRYTGTRVVGDRIFGSGSAIYHNNRRGFAWGSDTEDTRLELRGDGRYYVDDFYGSHTFMMGFNAIPDQQSYSAGVYANPVAIREARNDAGQWVQFYVQEYDPTRVNSWDFGIENYAGYIQDTWVATDRITINAGLRIENQRDEVLLDITEFSPNIGINYAITSDLKNTVRASYGIRHHLLAGRDGVSSVQRGTPSRTEYYDTDLDGNWDNIVTRSGSEGGATDPNQLTYWDGSPISYSDDLGMPFAHELQIGYTRLLPYSLKLDLAWIYKINKNSLYMYDKNPIYQNGMFAGYNNPALNSDFVYINDELSSNHFQSYEATLSKAFSDNWQLMASYTYQTSTLKGEWQDDDPLKYIHPESWFESHDDGVRPHIFRLATSVIFPFEITANANVTYMSATTIGAYYMPNGSGIDAPSTYTLSNGRVITHPFYTVRPFYQPRSEDREPAGEHKFLVNVGVGKNFAIMGYQLQAQVQVFNLFNDDSYAGQYYGNYVDITGEQIRDLYEYWRQPPRAAQAYIKLVF